MGLQGPKPSCSETERRLVETAAFQFALLSANKELACELGQNLHPARLMVDQLPDLGLPHPALVLRASLDEVLEKNLEIIDQKFARSPEQTPRRLMLAMDHTYLERSLGQTTLHGVRGLVGAPWHPASDGQELMPFADLPKDAALAPRAPLMLECLIWDPAALEQQVFSAASMPMSLTPEHEASSDRNHGKIAAGIG